MTTRALGPNTWIWAIAAVAALAWSLIGVVFAAIGPSAYVPHVFHNPHAEHFAAFYALAFLAAVGLPRVRLATIIAGLAALAALLAAARLSIPAHRMSAAEDLLADVAGALAAIAPILAGRFRELAAQSARDGGQT
jgi:hypothetical protein